MTVLSDELEKVVTQVTHQLEDEQLAKNAFNSFMTSSHLPDFVEYLEDKNEIEPKAITQIIPKEHAFSLYTDPTGVTWIFVSLAANEKKDETYLLTIPVNHRILGIVMDAIPAILKGLAILTQNIIAAKTKKDLH